MNESTRLAKAFSTGYTKQQDIQIEERMYDMGIQTNEDVLTCWHEIAEDSLYAYIDYLNLDAELIHRQYEKLHQEIGLTGSQITVSGRLVNATAQYICKSRVRKGMRELVSAEKILFSRRFFENARTVDMFRVMQHETLHYAISLIGINVNHADDDNPVFMKVLYNMGSVINNSRTHKVDRLNMPFNVYTCGKGCYAIRGGKYRNGRICRNHRNTLEHRGFISAKAAIELIANERNEEITW